MKRESSNVIEFKCFRRDSGTSGLQETRAKISDEKITFQDRSDPSETGKVIYLEDHAGRRYSLVSKNENAGLGISTWRPDSTVETSAVTRIHGVLRQIKKLNVTIRYGNDSFVEAQIVPLSNPALPYFIVRVRDAQQLRPGERIRMDLDLFGMRFAFACDVIEFDSVTDQLALTLPEKISRKMTRSAPRSSCEPLTLERVGDQNQKLRLLDISVNGLAFEDPAGSSILMGESVVLKIGNLTGKSYQVHGLIVGHSHGVHHVSLWIDDANRKAWVVDILKIQYPQLEWGYDAQKAWQCLVDFGYLDLLETPQFKISNEDCLKTWRARQEDSSFFQPVAEIGGRLGGTYGIVRQAEDHWVQQCLATRVDPEFISVTSALYSAWPQYVLTENAPLWITAQFDSEKRWHNRFFGVFAQEASTHAQFTRFHRHWHWSCDLKKISHSTSLTQDVFDEASTVLQKEALALLKPYAKCPTPWFELKKKKFGEQRSHAVIVTQNQKLQGVILYVLSERPVNPFGVFHVGHVFAALGTEEERLALTKELLRIAHQHLMATGLSSAALTHDYDVDPKQAGLDLYEYFCCTEVQSHTESLIPAFLSVTALNAADMEIRHGLHRAS